MNKGKLYTVLVCCMSVTIVFGGWFMTKEMLNRKETEILAVKGQILQETSVPQSEQSFEGEDLSEEVIAEVLMVWENGGREEFHEPLTGQTNMEQAIEAGRDWMDTMVENHILPTELSDGEFESINAVLCTIDSQTSLEKSLISYWTVTYRADDVTIILRIHAVSGQVWKADISMGVDKVPTEPRADEELLAIAFPFLKSVSADIVVEDNKKVQNFKQGKVYASLKWDSLAVNTQEPVTRLLLWLYAN